MNPAPGRKPKFPHRSAHGANRGQTSDESTHPQEFQQPADSPSSPNHAPMSALRPPGLVGQRASVKRPVPPPPSRNSSVVTGLVIGGVALVAIVVLVVGLVLSSSTPRQIPTEEGQVAKPPAEPTAVRVAQDAEEVRARQLTKSFLSGSKEDLAILKEAADSLEQVNETILSANNERIKAAELEVADLIRELDALETQIESARSKEQKLESDHRDARAKVQELRAAQSPLNAYLSTYDEFRAAVDAEMTAHLTYQQSEIDLAAAASTVFDKRDKLADVEASAAVAEGAQERAATRLALDNATAELDSARQARDTAHDTRMVALDNWQKTTSTLTEMGKELIELRKQLDEADPQTANMLKVIKEFEEKLVEKARAARAVKDADNALNQTTRAGDNPSKSYSTLRQAYLVAHSAFLAASKERSQLEQRYLAGGNVTKDQIRRATEAERNAKDEDERTRREMNDAQKKVEDERASEAKLLKAQRDAMKNLQLANDALTPAAEKVAKATKEAQRSGAAGEEKRQGELTKAVADQKDLADRLSIARTKRQDIEADADILSRRKLAISNDLDERKAELARLHKFDVVEPIQKLLEFVAEIEGRVFTAAEARQLRDMANTANKVATAALKAEDMRSQRVEVFSATSKAARSLANAADMLAIELPS